MDKQRSMLTQVKKERIKRQTSVPAIEPGPSDWESSAPSDKPLGPGSMPGTEVCLFILSFFTCVTIDLCLAFVPHNSGSQSSKAIHLHYIWRELIIGLAVMELDCVCTCVCVSWNWTVCVHVCVMELDCVCTCVCVSWNWTVCVHVCVW